MIHRTGHTTALTHASLRASTALVPRNANTKVSTDATVQSTAADSFRTVFSQGAVQPSSTAAPAATPAPASPAVPAFQPTFIQNATVTNPDGSSQTMNASELATPDTAQQVAALLGGTVVSSDSKGPFTQSDSVLSIQVPGSSNLINAGLAANLFAQFGTAKGSLAWSVINNDLGRNG